MALIDRIKERTATDLSDTELSAMIAGVLAEIEERAGPAGAIEILLGDPGEDYRWRKVLTLPRPADLDEAIEVVELEPGDSGAAGDEVTLTDTDFRVFHGGRTLQRLTGGPNGNSFWAPMVRITYTPLGQQAARDEVAIKLIQLDLSYRGGLKSERAGDYQFTLGGDPVEERDKLLASLMPGRPFMMA